ncbi:PadR family transcriptional regulator [Sulfidibacter corallicola]|uniref:PadR family transcriptional regulator n=1 Tax=Sulfidibacter corallicola TaxID=2818388 RepID=A0A8A4TGI3_SULCO|nr:PadR family transcriptional regulator [Sulfidibacter corallicola]QTD48753.1 PadR family transcriptional regulator [Sulfidibacter corallicola]
MKGKKLTDSELLVLGLVSEMPRHGYELEQVIDGRGMREWTQIGFSSIYFVLGKLEKAGFVSAEKPAGRKAKKVFSITRSGQDALAAQTAEALGHYRPTFSSVLLGMIHWEVLSREASLAALDARRTAVARELERLERIRFESQPLPDFIEALFDFSEGQLQAEKQWIETTSAYMEAKP